MEEPSLQALTELKTRHACRHGNPDSDKAHTCPFQLDVHDNDADWCFCCDACAQDCADDI